MQFLKYPGLFFFIIHFNLSFSQDIMVGPKAGLNIIPLEKTELSGNSFALGFHAGGVFEYRFNNWFSLSTDILYSAKRKTYEKLATESLYKKVEGMLSMFMDSSSNMIDSVIGGFSGYVNDTVYSRTKGFVKMGFAEIPVLAKFRYKSFSFSAGPYVALLFSNSATEELTQEIPLLKTIEPVLDTVPFLPQLIKGMFPGYSEPDVTEIASSDEIKVIDFGFVADITYQTSDNITFSIRYTRGIPNYRSPELRKNDCLSTINISIGYLFSLGKLTGKSQL